MLLNVLDATATNQKLVTHGQEAQLDKSGVIAATGVAQTLLAANTLRSGWIIQNRSSTNPMYVNELAAAATGVSANSGSFSIPAGGIFPPVGYPVSTGAISIMGTLSDTFVVREW